MDKTRNTYVYFVRFPLICLILLLSIMGVFARRGWLDLKRMTAQNSTLRQQIGAAAGQKQSLERQVDAFRADSAEQERVIRQTLGYVHKNEIIIQFD
jgi:cell division protein FtsB